MTKTQEAGAEVFVKFRIYIIENSDFFLTSIIDAKKSLFDLNRGQDINLKKMV